MPQKRNPDMAELVNGKAGRVFGHLVGLLAMLKGLPLTYNRDLQEDKEALFDAHDTLRDCLRVMTGMLETAVFQHDKMLAAAQQNPFLAATEVADYLARKGVPFRQAHGLTVEIVRYCEKNKKTLTNLSLKDWQTFSPLIKADIKERLSPKNVVTAKSSKGGTAPAQVKKGLDRAK
jgi:argininosuccinate lyase